MSTLAIWNLTKALEEDPKLDLKSALKAAQERLGHEAVDVAAILEQRADERHLSCALLAWQQLGHENSESLYRFAEAHLREDKQERPTCSKKIHTKDRINYEESESLKGSVSKSLDTNSPGPVFRLPVEPKIVMRLDSSRNNAQAQRVQKAGQDLKEKIEQACCLESGCVERLALLDAQTRELRGRLVKLSRREAARVELLERAETAWRDLEMGYMRRVRVVTEKEEDLERQTEKLIAERNDFKETCSKLVQVLKPRGEAAEKYREELNKVEGKVCERACERLKQSEISAKEDALLADMQCKCAQQDRDLQFKEEAARRKKQTLESEVESQRGLAYEVERAMRAELGGLKHQLKVVSKELLAEDAAIAGIKTELEELQKEKCGIAEDLEGCQLVCDKGMQKKVDELKMKQNQLRELKDKVLDCRCKAPIDVAVEVKRTPSLAALCHCKPEDRFLESCSCTSLRSRLLSDFLSDLFGGLQTELGNAGTRMPCQLLKCLEDRHNWDRTSVVKSNLRSFFAKLLVGELDIAIATSIEKYHAKWVGASCADVARNIPEIGGKENEGWEERAIQHRARKLASQLAEEMFQEKADEIMEKAKDVVTKGPPPCECNPSHNTAAYPCFVPQRNVVKGDGAGAVATHVPVKTPRTVSQAPWQRAINDVTRLRLQIEDLKRDSIKKEDLKLMERKITRLVQQTSSPEPIRKIKLLSKETEMTSNYIEENAMESKHKKPLNVDALKTKNKTSNKQNFQNESADKPPRKNIKRQYAVNLCLCGLHRNSLKVPQQVDINNSSNECSPSNPWKKRASKEIVSHMSSSVRHGKPITQLISQENTKEDDKKKQKLPCGSTCACFNKIPSCTSIDKLLHTLTKWKGDLNYHPEVTKDVTTKISRLKIIDTKELNTNFSNILTQPDTISKDFSFSPYNSLLNKPKYDTVVKVSSVIMRKNHTEDKKALPNTTVSEYMGAVNLEKSNENFCKCVIVCNDNNKQNNKNVSVQINCGNASKCINTNLLEFGKKRTESCFRNKNQEKSENHNFANKPHIKSKVEINSQKHNIHVPSEISTGNLNYDTNKAIDPSLRCEKISRASDAQNLGRSFNSVSCDCDYQIKFLGATLAESRSINRLTSTPRDNTILASPTLQKNEKYSKDEIVHPINDPELSGRNLSVCQCNIKVDKLKAFFDSAIHRKCGDFTDTKMISTSFATNASSNIQDDCVCCIESHDLEVNTFDLLEKHLRKRLKELKNNCNSSCIQPEDECKLFQTIFKKIKHTVLDTTDKVTCKCSEDAHSDRAHSWQRAFVLLQEYLRTKIGRIQCTCSTLSESKAILPILTDKVCDLIESDFQRLKDICKCKNSTLESQISRQPEFQVPERDINCSTARKQTHNQFLTQNASSQILPETQSCEVMAKSFNCMTTVEIQKPDIDDLFTGSKHSVCLGMSDLIDIVNEKSLRNMAIITDNNSILCEVIGDVGCLPPVIKHTDNTKELINVIPTQKKSLPFIGYTIDCSCNPSLGACVCSKSMIQENINNNENFWTSYTKTLVGKPNISSYIMQNVYPNKDDDHVEITEHFCKDNFPKIPTSELITPTICEVNTNLDDNDIVLKKSLENVNKIPTHNSTSTGDYESNSSETCCNWYEACCQPSTEIAKMKSVHFPTDLHHIKSKIITKETLKQKDLFLHQDCECSMVPICHVKMLVNNIEDKLANSECTCDSLSSKVCPIHGGKF